METRHYYIIETMYSVQGLVRGDLLSAATCLSFGAFVRHTVSSTDPAKLQGRGRQS